MAEPHAPDWIEAAFGAGATAFVGLLGWLGVRAQTKAPKADPQAVQNHGWESLLDQMRQELKASARAREHLNRVLEEERRGWRAEREVWRLQRDAFLGEIHQLQAVAEGFERLLRRNGIELPARKAYGPSPTAEIVNATLSQDSLGEED